MSENDLREFKPEESAAPKKSPVQPSYEEAKKAASGLNLSLAQVREIYVGKDYHKFEKAFAKFDTKGAAANSFAIAPVFLNGFWFFYRKMYVEGLIVLAVSLAVAFGAEHLLKSGANGASIGVTVAVAMSAKSIFWRAVDKKIAKAMQLYPDSPDNAVAWLRAKGGVNYWALALGLIFIALSIGGAVITVMETM